MIRSKYLPENWTMSISQKHNRPFYFNVITKESTWVHPNSNPDVIDNVVNQKGQNMSKEVKKRKADEIEKEDSVSLDPVSPREQVPDDERRKLRGRRLLNDQNDNKTEDKTENKDENQSNETPQMKLLRERMKQRLAKGNAVKRKQNTDPNEVVHPETTKKCTNNNDTTTLDKSKKTETKDAALNGEANKMVSMTPQMRLSQARLDAKKSLTPALIKKLQSIAKKNEEPKAKEPDDGKKMNLRSKSICTTPTKSTSNDVENKKTTPSKLTKRQSIEKNLKLIRTVEAPPGVSAKRVKIDHEMNENSLVSISDSNKTIVTNVPQKKLSIKLVKEPQSAQKRLKVQTNLSENENKYSPVDKPVAIPSKQTSPVFYKNAEERMRKLRERLSYEISDSSFNSSDEKLSFTSKSEEPDNSSPVACLKINKTSLVKRINTFEEKMEWEPIDNDQIISEVRSVRAELEDDIDIDMTEIPTLSLDTVDTVDAASNIRLYIVIDTNVFLTDLRIIENVRDSNFERHGRPIVVIPWTVLRELDHIKEDRMKNRPECLKAKARQAINFLNSHFAARHPRILGQTQKDVAMNRKQFKAECPDDEILQVCLQIRDSGNSIVLLSYDNNLCNKAMVHDVTTLNRSDPIDKINYFDFTKTSNDSSSLSTSLKMTGNNPQLLETSFYMEKRIAEDLYEEIETFLNTFLSVIVAKQMQTIFGDNWLYFTLIKPPWTAVTVLKCAIKHWIAAVNEAFSNRTGEIIMKDLLKIISNLKYNKPLKDIGNLIEKSFDLIQCVKSCDNYNNLVATSIESINDLRKRYEETAKQIKDQEFLSKFGAEKSEEEQEICATRAFRCFEKIYAFSRDFGGTTALLINMPTSMLFIEITSLTIDDVKCFQSDITANVHNLLKILSSTLDNLESLHFNHNLIIKLHHSLTNFFPEALEHIVDDIHDLTPLDVYYCLKLKEESLKLGLGQLQELSTHYCRLATFEYPN